MQSFITIHIGVDFMSDDPKRQARIAYIASLLTPVTLMLSGILAVIYAAYQLNKGADKLTYSHYYTIIRTFFLFFTFFVVLGVTAATTSGMAAGAGYWVQSSFLDMALQAIPVVGIIIAALAIISWFIKHVQGMKRLSQNLPIEL